MCRKGISMNSHIPELFKYLKRAKGGREMRSQTTSERNGAAAENFQEKQKQRFFTVLSAQRLLKADICAG